MQAVVLIVDDEEPIRRLLKAILSMDYTVLTANDGAEAYAVFRELGGAVDLVLTDLFMPNMDGAELARQLREEKPDLPILFMSGMVDDIARVEIFIRKPFDQAALKAVIQDALSSNPQQDAP
jgi:two-component system, cell cycle sensor histidine kinase and response regulator CckA